MIRKHQTQPEPAGGVHILPGRWMHTDHTQNGPGAAPVCIGDVEPGREFMLSVLKRQLRKEPPTPFPPPSSFFFPFPLSFFTGFYKMDIYPGSCFLWGESNLLEIEFVIFLRRRMQMLEFCLSPL